MREFSWIISISERSDGIDFVSIVNPDNGCFPARTGDAGDDINPSRCYPDLENRVALFQVLRRQILQWGAKPLERPQNRRCVVTIRLHPYVDIHRGSRIAIGSESVGADKKVLNLLFG